MLHVIPLRLFPILKLAPCNSNVCERSRILTEGNYVRDLGLFALWGVGVVVEACRGSWTVSWDDDRTQEFTLGASSTKTRMQFGYPNFLQRPKTLQFQRCDFNV